MLIRCVTGEIRHCTQNAPGRGDSECNALITTVTSDLRLVRQLSSTALLNRSTIHGVKSLLCALVSLLLGIRYAPAQSAVLIGLHVEVPDDGNVAPPPSYRTLLITFRDGKAQLAADLPDLIVPRKDGFWRVGI